MVDLLADEAVLFLCGRVTSVPLLSGDPPVRHCCCRERSNLAVSLSCASIRFRPRLSSLVRPFLLDKLVAAFSTLLAMTMILAARVAKRQPPDGNCVRFFEPTFQRPSLGALLPAVLCLLGFWKGRTESGS